MGVKKLLDYDDPKLRDAFCRDLAKAVAKQMKRVPTSQREPLRYILQDSTSLFNPYTHGLIEKELRKL